MYLLPKKKVHCNMMHLFFNCKNINSLDKTSSKYTDNSIPRCYSKLVLNSSFSTQL